MRKVILFCLFLGWMALPVFAGTISIDVLSSDAGVSYEWFNNAMSTITNTINGDIESVNIKDNSITDSDLSTAVKFENWYTESIGDWTYSGMLPQTSADLTSNITAGVSYVNGQRIVTSATSHTYTASKDTWVYIDKNGAFQFVEVANGASQPTTPTDSLLLAKVVTDTDNITSVEDKRQTTPPGLRIYSDYKDGLVISRDEAVATIVTIGRGEIEFGTDGGKRRNIGRISIDTTTTGRGGLDTGSLAQGFYYVWAVPDDDNSTGFEGVASTSRTATALNISGERLVGWFYADSASSISADSIGAYKGRGGDAPNIVVRKKNGAASYAAAGSYQVIPDMIAKFYCSGERPVRVTFTGYVNNSSGGNTILTISADNTEITKGEVNQDGVGGSMYIPIHLEWVGHMGEGEHTIEVKWSAENAGHTINCKDYRTLVIEEL